jgi:F-type H+-transporting ATPase subunit epsilon
MPDTNIFAVELVTPERVLVDGLATEVVLRTGEGDITFLAGHAPLVGTVEPGVVRVVRAEGDEERVATHGGFVQVDRLQDRDGTGAGGDAASRTRVTLLIGVAELVADIDVPRARAALEAAEARMAELAGSGARATGPAEEEVDPELIEVEAARRRAEVRIEAVETGASVVQTGGAN